MIIHVDFMLNLLRDLMVPFLFEKRNERETAVELQGELENSKMGPKG